MRIQLTPPPLALRSIAIPADSRTRWTAAITQLSTWAHGNVEFPAASAAPMRAPSREAYSTVRFV